MAKNTRIFGINAIEEALLSGVTFEKILFNPGKQQSNFKRLMAKLKAHDVPVKKVPKIVLDKINRVSHQGMIGFISPLEYFRLEDILDKIYDEGRLPFILFLDQITDVRNFGAIARSAHAFGVDAIVIPVQNSVQISADAIKTSAGALTHLKVCRVSSMQESIDYVRQYGLKVLGVTEKSSSEISAADLSLPMGLVMGSEHDGISPSILKMLDGGIRIPMQSDWDSLNVSVAAGIAMYKVKELAKR